MKENNGIVSNEQVETLRKMITANGRSFSDPIYNSDCSVNMTQSRRVEIKFRPKNDKLIEDMQNLFGD